MEEKICIECGAPIPLGDVGDGEYCKGEKCHKCVHEICKLCCDSDFADYEYSINNRYENDYYDD